MIKIKSIFFMKTNFLRRLFSNSKEFGFLNRDLIFVEEKRHPQKLDQWNLYRSTPENFDQSLSNIILFPGQGSQFVGMGKKLINFPQAQRLFESASEYLKYDLQEVCLNGPAEKLQQTIYNQPAIFVTSLAAIEKIKETQPELIENCIATAGMSLGEITSLVFSGALSFEAGLYFVSVRSKVMEEACLKTKGGLMVVYVNSRSNLNEAMQSAKQYCYEKLKIEKHVCEISSDLFTECKTIGGHVEALDFVETFSKEFKLKGCQRLNVAGAFHTSLMDDAYLPCQEALDNIDFTRPRISVMSNATGTVHTSISAIKRSLASQVNHRVFWEQILHRLYTRPPEIGSPVTVEVGPGTSLGPTIKRVNAPAFKKYKNISV